MPFIGCCVCRKQNKTGIHHPFQYAMRRKQLRVLPDKLNNNAYMDYGGCRTFFRLASVSTHPHSLQRREFCAQSGFYHKSNYDIFSLGICNTLHYSPPLDPLEGLGWVGGWQTAKIPSDSPIFRFVKPFIRKLESLFYRKRGFGICNTLHYSPPLEGLGWVGGWQLRKFHLYGKRDKAIHFPKR